LGGGFGFETDLVVPAGCFELGVMRIGSAGDRQVDCARAFLLVAGTGGVSQTSETGGETQTAAP
jgi:hypothetical protein